MVTIENTDLEGLKIIKLDMHIDHRGSLTESWRDEWNILLGTNIDFIQDMVSYNPHRGTLRGLHSLTPNCPQYKAVMVVSGVIFDVVVDARKESSTYGKVFTRELADNEYEMLIIPPGCFHGYQTLVDHTVVSYKVDHYHTQGADIGIKWNDPDLNIQWPILSPNVSERDKNHPFFKSYEYTNNGG